LVNEKLLASNESFSNIVERTADGILIIDSDGIIKYCNEAARQMLNRTDEDLLDAQFGLPIMTDSSVEIGILSKTEEKGVAEMRVMETNWAGSTAMLVSIRDVTETVRLREELHKFAYIDELTGLNNRRGFVMLANQLLLLSNRSVFTQVKRPMMLMFADLDYLKRINDDFGHEKGDLVLQDVADVLRKTFRLSDIIARLGGDEFAVLAIDADNDEPQLRKRLQTNVDLVNEKNTCQYTLSLSVGFAWHDPATPCTVNELLRIADNNMYFDKFMKHSLLNNENLNLDNQLNE